jgi:Zn-dependent membrane protease YugP
MKRLISNRDQAHASAIPHPIHGRFHDADEHFGHAIDEISITSTVPMTSLFSLLSLPLSYYYGYGPSTGGYSLFSGGYFLIWIGTMVLSLVASLIVRGAYSKYSKVPASSGMTGAEVAQRILDVSGIHDVVIQPIPGNLTDHYDPRAKTLNLSEDNYYGRSVAALGVAAHECGHALQHQQKYAPLELRMSAVGITNFASSLIFWIPLLGMFSHLISLHTTITFVAIGWGILMLFQLITLPVEFDATARAKRIIPQLGAVAPGAEIAGMNRVLNAAALTYVAAFVSSLAYFLYYLIRLQGNSRN